MGESISEFMKRRGREVTRFGREAEAAAHEVYGQAIRAGKDLNLASPGEVARHGANLLEERANRAATAVSNTAQQGKLQVGKALHNAGKNPTVRSVAIGTARGAGNVAGVVRGGAHAVEGLLEGAIFAGRLADPFDGLKSPQGDSAIEQFGRGVVNAGRAAAGYVAKGVADPRSVVTDIRDKAQEWRRDLDFSATPTAPTFEGELRRNFKIGQNQGELVFDLGSLVVGGPAAKAVKGLGGVSNVGKVEKYVAQGFSPKAAAHLAKPYPSRGMGHHFMPRRVGLPKSYSDSVFNVLKPGGISRGDFYELHFNVDPKYWGNSAIPGEKWSGKDLGLTRNGLAGRLWHGSPPPLKARAGGLGAGAGTAMYVPKDEETGW